MVLKVGLPIQTEDFLNIQFKGFRGKDVQKYEPIIQHLKRMIKCYILEITKMDVEIAGVLNNRPILKPNEQPEDIEYLKARSIRKKHWNIVYKRKKGEVVQNNMFFKGQTPILVNDSQNNLVLC
ncbi:unnamed protein product [Lactuca saligna]|uniref:Uncharacterized protein n=1 Tax=Lactuca saligna TaxID=75948 RepID=A0AA35VMZ1_LACSI|nr:unnamed protein product [Lactuca saligna]